MNTHSQWRLEYAQQVAAAYAENPKVQAIFLGGSTSRGHADQYSDIEIGAFWHTPPTDQDRQNAAAKTGGDLITLYPYDEAEQLWSDDLMLGRDQNNTEKSGVLVEVVNHTTQFYESVLDDVLINYNPNLLKLNLVAVLTHAVPLHNPALIEAWISRIQPYPKELAAAVIQRHAQIDHYWRWQMWLDRGPNHLMLTQSFNQIIEKLLHILLALNGVYYFGFKWIDIILNQLTLAPPNFGPRLKVIHTNSLAQAAQDLAALVEETYDLIEQHHPDIDINRLRSIFRYQRPVWLNKPPR